MDSITSVILAHPIERMRSGSVVVSVNVTFSDGRTFSGFATTPDSEDEAALVAAFDAAVARAVERAGASIQPKSLGTVQDAIMEAALPAVQESFTQRLNNQAMSQEQFDRLMDPPEKHMVDELDGLCDALGIDRIPAAAKGWNTLETISASAALRRLVKKLEAPK